MRTLRSAQQGQGRVNVVAHRTIDRDFDSPPSSLPGTPAGGPNYTVKQGNVPYGEVAERYEAGTVSFPDYYQAGNSRQFNTRVH
jgi:hypothetical protein